MTSTGRSSNAVRQEVVEINLSDVLIELALTIHRLAKSQRLHLFESLKRFDGLEIVP